MRLIDLVLSGTVSRVVCEWQDRLARYGVKTFELLCERMGVELVISGTGEEEAGEKTAEEEMASDIMSLITVYAARKHGARGGDATRMEVTPEARERIFGLHSDGLSLNAIVETLAEEGFKCPRTGKDLSVWCVHKTLRKGYVGRLVDSLVTDKAGLMRNFIQERCKRSPGEKRPTTEFAAAFTEYARERGVVLSSSKEPTVLLKQVGYQCVRDSRRRNWITGLALKS